MLRKQIAGLSDEVRISRSSFSSVDIFFCVFHTEKLGSALCVPIFCIPRRSSNCILNTLRSTTFLMAGYSSHVGIIKSKATAFLIEQVIILPF